MRCYGQTVSSNTGSFHISTPGKSLEKEYHAEIVSIGKFSLARPAIMLPVTDCIHMLLDSSQASEISRACFTLPSVMAIVVHVFVAVISSIEPLDAVVTLVLWWVMVEVIHVLVAIIPCIKSTIALVTFVLWLAPMVEGIHMLITGAFTGKGTVAGIALEHDWVKFRQQ